MRPVVFLGNSLEKVRSFPDRARNRAGYQIELVQRGRDPDSWKPMPSIGAGVREIRIRDEAGTFRVIYVATRDEAVYVLHAFQKRGRRTNHLDIELAATRYRRVMRGER